MGFYRCVFLGLLLQVGCATKSQRLVDLKMANGERVPATADSAYYPVKDGDGISTYARTWSLRDGETPYIFEFRGEAASFLYGLGEEIRVRGGGGHPTTVFRKNINLYCVSLARTLPARNPVCYFNIPKIDKELRPSSRNRPYVERHSGDWTQDLPDSDNRGAY